MRRITAEQIIDAMRERGIGRAMLAEVDNETLSERGALFRRLEDLRRRERAELPPLRKAHEAAKGAAEEARAKYEAAKLAELRAEQQAMSASHSLESQANRVTRKIADLAPAELDVFIADCRDLVVKCRNAAQFELTAGRKDVSTSYYYQREVITNGPAVTAAVAQISATIASAEDLKLAELSRGEILERVKELRAGLPSPDDLQATIQPSAMNSIAMLGEAMREAETPRPYSETRPRRAGRSAAFFG